jgi:hypothetical protein|tara:strand:- start:89 stop:289 length:201 start_codon:yes stop_codon:yes gene_type:complete
MNITKAKYVMSKKYDESSKSWVNDKNESILATIDGQEWSLPLVKGNRHYDAIQEWVAKGNSIEEAD